MMDQEFPAGSASHTKLVPAYLALDLHAGPWRTTRISPQGNKAPGEGATIAPHDRGAVDSEWAAPCRDFNQISLRTAQRRHGGLWSRRSPRTAARPVRLDRLASTVTETARGSFQPAGGSGMQPMLTSPP